MTHNAESVAPPIRPTASLAEALLWSIELADHGNFPTPQDQAAWVVACLRAQHSDGNETRSQGGNPDDTR